MHVLELEHVTFAYRREPVLVDVSLRIDEGEFLAVVGPNGGGKTTLVKLALGLLKPDKGRVRLLGGPPARTRVMVGYMPQHVLVDPAFPVSVGEVVEMGRVGARDGMAVEEALGLVGLKGMGREGFGALSGGQQQRVLLARALVGRPRMLVLDEPTSHVDAAGEWELYELLRRLHSQGVTVIVVTHDLGFISPYARTVACVNRRVVIHPTSSVDGRLIAEIYGRQVRMVRHDHPRAGSGQEE